MNSEPVNNTAKFMAKKQPSLILDTAKSTIRGVIACFKPSFRECPNRELHLIVAIPVNAENQYFVDFLKSKNIGANMIVYENECKFSQDLILPGEYHAIFFETEIIFRYEIGDLLSVYSNRFVNKLNQFGLNATEHVVDRNMRVV